MLRTLTINRGAALAGPARRWSGLVLDLILLVNWVANGFRLTDLSYFGVFGLLLIVLGFQTFTFTILVQMLGRRPARLRP